jgi:hypothetical protein
MNYQKRWKLFPAFLFVLTLNPNNLYARVDR